MRLRVEKKYDVVGRSIYGKEIYSGEHYVICLVKCFFFKRYLKLQYSHHQSFAMSSRVYLTLVRDCCFASRFDTREDAMKVVSVIKGNADKFILV